MMILQLLSILTITNFVVCNDEPSLLNPEINTHNETRKKLPILEEDIKELLPNLGDPSIPRQRLEILNVFTDSDGNIHYILKGHMTTKRPSNDWKAQAPHLIDTTGQNMYINRTVNKANLENTFNAKTKIPNAEPSTKESLQIKMGETTERSIIRELPKEELGETINTTEEESVNSKNFNGPKIEKTINTQEEVGITSNKLNTEEQPIADMRVPIRDSNAEEWTPAGAGITANKQETETRVTIKKPNTEESLKTKGKKFIGESNTEKHIKPQTAKWEVSKILEPNTEERFKVEMPYYKDPIEEKFIKAETARVIDIATTEDTARTNTKEGIKEPNREECCEPTIGYDLRESNIIEISTESEIDPSTKAKKTDVWLKPENVETNTEEFTEAKAVKPTLKSLIEETPKTKQRVNVKIPVKEVNIEEWLQPDTAVLSKEETKKASNKEPITDETGISTNNPEIEETRTNARVSSKQPNAEEQISQIRDNINGLNMGSLKAEIEKYTNKPDTRYTNKSDRQRATTKKSINKKSYKPEMRETILWTNAEEESSKTKIEKSTKKPTTGETPKTNKKSELIKNKNKIAEPEKLIETKLQDIIHELLGVKESTEAKTRMKTTDKPRTTEMSKVKVTINEPITEKWPIGKIEETLYESNTEGSTERRGKISNKLKIENKEMVNELHPEETSKAKTERFTDQTETEETPRIETIGSIHKPSLADWHKNTEELSESEMGSKPVTENAPIITKILPKLKIKDIINKLNTEETANTKVTIGEPNVTEWLKIQKKENLYGLNTEKPFKVETTKSINEHITDKTTTKIPFVVFQHPITEIGPKSDIIEIVHMSHTKEMPKTNNKVATKEPNTDERLETGMREVFHGSKQEEPSQAEVDKPVTENTPQTKPIITIKEPINTKELSKPKIKEFNNKLNTGKTTKVTDKEPITKEKIKNIIYGLDTGEMPKSNIEAATREPNTEERLKIETGLNPEEFSNNGINKITNKPATVEALRELITKEPIAKIEESNTKLPTEVKTEQTTNELKVAKENATPVTKESKKAKSELPLNIIFINTPRTESKPPEMIKINNQLIIFPCDNFDENKLCNQPKKSVDSSIITLLLKIISLLVNKNRLKANVIYNLLQKQTQFIEQYKQLILPHTNSYEGESDGNPFNYNYDELFSDFTDYGYSRTCDRNHNLRALTNLVEELNIAGDCYTTDCLSRDGQFKIVSQLKKLADNQLIKPYKQFGSSKSAAGFPWLREFENRPVLRKGRRHLGRQGCDALSNMVQILSTEVNRLRQVK